jgi:DNA-binding cell septation regulator SpoVG
MKQQWAAQELIDHWTLTSQEVTQIQSVSQTAYNQIGYGVLFKTFQRDGKFPQRKQDIPPVIIEHVGRQLRVPETALDFYSWTGRSAKRHRVHIRKLLGFRLGTVDDAGEAISWLTAYALEHDERHADRLKDAVYEHYRNLKIAPPPPGSIERIIRSAVRTADETAQTKVLGKLPSVVRERLDTLVEESRQEDAGTLLSTLKNEAGAATLENVLHEIAKLDSLRSLAIPEGLFAGIPRKRLLRHTQRVAVEDLFEIRRHPPRVRYSILAAFCIVRADEITDTLVELLISVIHKMGSRAKHIVNKEIIRDIKRVQGKNRLLYEVAQASIEKPEGTVKDVIYPVAPEQTLHDLVAEYKQVGLYEQRIQTIMRGSYSNHYRRMVPHILKTLSFCAANETSKPIIEALELMRKYADKHISSIQKRRLFRLKE